MAAAAQATQGASVSSAVFIYRNKPGFAERSLFNVANSCQHILMK